MSKPHNLYFILILKFVSKFISRFIFYFNINICLQISLMLNNSVMFSGNKTIQMK